MNVDNLPPIQSQTRKNPLIVFALSSLTIIFLGLLDYLTGWELGFFAFYFIPISFVAWFSSTRYAVISSVFSAFVWSFADIAISRHYSSIFFAIWNSSIRLLSFLMIALMVSKMRIVLRQEKDVSRDLRDALAQLKTLKGMLPICASCKKIRNNKGYWEQIETYIADHSEAEFTHGLCEECARKLYPQVFSDEDQ